GRAVVTRASAPADRAASEKREVAHAELRPSIEQFQTAAFDTLEHADATKPGQAQLQTQPAADFVAHEPAFLELRARECGTSLDRTGPLRSNAPARQFRFVRVASALNVARHVQASAAPIPTEILPEIRQLKGGAQGIRGSIEPIVAIPGDPQHEPADRIRRPATVVEHVAPRS